MKPFLSACLLLTAMSCATPALAKLPAPSDEAKSKAAEAAAKAAHNGKVDAYLLCKSMDKVAADYYAAAKKSGTEAKPPTATPPCVDPGPFVYSAPAPASAAAVAPGAAVAATATAAAPMAAPQK